MHSSIYIPIESFFIGRHDKFIQLITQHFKVILSTKSHQFQLPATKNIEYIEDIIPPLDRAALIQELNEETEKYTRFLQHNASSLLNVQIELEHAKNTIDSVKSKSNNTFVKAKQFLSLINYRKICLVLVSAEYSYLSRPIVIEAKKKGIPVMNIEHGFFAGSCYPDAYIDEFPILSPFISDYVIVNDNFEVDLLGSFAKKSRQEHIPLFLPLGTPVAKLSPGAHSKKQVMKTLKLDPGKKTLSLFSSWVEPLTPLHIFQAQFEEAAFFDFIFQSISQYPHRESLQIIIKLHPAFKLFGEKGVFDYLLERKSQYGLSNVVIHTDNFQKILTASDYVICPHYGSEMWESLEINKPLAVKFSDSFLTSTKPDILTQANELAKHDLLHIILNESDLHSFLETYAKEDQTQQLIKRKNAFMKKWDIKPVSPGEASLNIIHWIKENIYGKATERVANLALEIAKNRSPKSFLSPVHYQKPSETYYENARKDLPSMIHGTPEKILEIGCATGAMGQFVKQKYSCEYIGVEINADVARMAEDRLDRVITADVEKIDLGDHDIAEKSLDYIILGDVLEHLYDPWTVLYKCGRFLKDEGYILASIPNIRNLQVVDRLIKGFFTYKDEGILDSTHLRFFTLHEIKNMFVNAGFSIEQIVPLRGNIGVNLNTLGEKTNLELGNILLKDLSKDDVAEFSTIQFCIKARKENGFESKKMLPEKSENKVSIIIVTYNSVQDIQPCIQSIRSNTGVSHEIIIVDNNSTDGTHQYLNTLKDVNVILNSKNNGFSCATNQGIKVSSGQYVIFLNPDTVVTRDWAQRMMSHFKEGVGAVGPVSNYVAGLQKVEFYRKEPVIGEIDINTLAEKLYQWNKGKEVETKLLIGFCLMIKKDVIANIGMLDEDLFLGSDDLEYSWRLRNNGYSLVVATDTFIYHKGQSSFKSEPDQKMTQFTQESQDVLYAKLETHYGKGHVPSSSELWGMDWFKPSSLVEANSKLTSIVILTHNQLEYTKKCIESIFTHTKEPFELIVVDNGSTDGTIEYLETEVGGGRTEDGDRKADIRVRIIKNRENLGFAAGNNQGMAAARGNYIHLMNNDIVVTPGWLDRMVSCAERDPKIGIVGPMSNYVSGPQLVENVPYNMESLEGLDDFAAKFSDQYDSKTQRILRVVGFCMLIKRAVINKIGGMDSRYGLGNFEDDDFSLRATLAGFESWIAEDCFIHHFGNRTFIGAKIDYRESLHKNWEIFKEKWDFPRDIPYGSYNVSDILEKGFIPEKHYCPLPDTPVSTVYDMTGIPESDDVIEPEIVFKKKSKPGMVSIIVPVSGTAKHLKKCVSSIKAHTPLPHEIIFLDNGCKGGTLKWIRQTVKRKSNYRMIKAGKGAVISKRYNLGMEASSGEYIILLQNHVCVADKWCEGLLECMNMVADTGIVSPMTNGKAAGNQCVEDSVHVGTDNLEEYAGVFFERNRHRRIPSREVADFCMLFRRSLVKHIGPFDEELERGSESDDYCLRAAIEGYRNLIAGDVFVLCTTLPPKGNKRSFDYKWRNIDAKSHDGERLGVLNAITDAEKLYQREEVDEAIVTLIDGIKYRPDENALYHGLAEMLIDCERFKEGLETINSIPEDKRVSSRTLELTGYCKAGLELYEEAAQCADRALSLNGSSAPALNLMGVLVYGKGDKSASEDFFKKAIASDPGYGGGYTNLGVLSWEAGRKESTLETLEKGFILSPVVEDSRTAYFSAISETAEFERAENVFREAKTLYPQSRRIAFLLIDILIRQEKYESAMQDIREAMITFGINDAILSAAQEVLDRFDAQETKDIEEKPSLSLCMIVKDEENYLARCLMSAIPVADEIIIVDTGSTDRTKAIAKAFGARVYDFEWTDDFSEARNLSLEKATGDWIFVLDADETISPLDYDRLNKIVKNNAAHPAAYSVITRNYVRPIYITGWTCNNGQYTDEEDGTGWYPSKKVRLFTNDNRIRFEAPIHELIEPSLIRLGIKAKECSIPVHHYGQLDWDNYIAKGEKYYLLGKRKLEENGDNLQSLIELAIQAGGEFKKYDEAVDLWKRVLKLDPDFTKAFLNMGYAYFKLEKYEEARATSKKAMEHDPGLKEAFIVYTTCEILLGDPGLTIPIIEELLKEVPGYPMALAILAAAYGMGDEREKGQEHIKYLMKMGFGCANYLHDLSERLVSTGKIDKAVAVLEFAVESGNGTREIRELLDGLMVR